MADITDAVPRCRRFTAELEDWGPLDEATGEAHADRRVPPLWQDGYQEAGVWECTPGPLRTEPSRPTRSCTSWPWRMTVHPGRRRGPRDIGPGDLAVFPRGWAGTWQIHEKIRKVYVIF